MKLRNNLLRIVFILVITGVFILTGWPVVYAANTGVKTAGGNTAVTSSAGDNNGFETTPTNTTSSNNAYAFSLNSGSAASSSCGIPNTGSDQHDFTTFGISTIPATAKVTGIIVAPEAKYDNNSGINTLCIFLTYDGGTNWTTGKNTADIQNSDSTNTLGSSSDLWGRSAWTTTELNDTNFKVRVMTLVASTVRDASLDYLPVTVHYNEAPNTPTQNSPANSATGVSLTPTFLMTATDNDSDKLGYKVTIYSNSGCTTVVQTNDQAVSATGWTGTDASCTAVPTSCYVSGTQASFLTQTALSASTQYWWKASAKDPDGTGNFTDSSTCNTFTTGVAQSLTFSISDNTIGFATLTSSAARYATGDTTGSTTEVEAHTITASTNASSGYVITVNGATLTSGANTITAIGSSNTASSAGTEQFGLRLNASGGNGAVSSPYAAAGFAFDTANFPDQIASDADGDDVSTTYSARYLGNISTTTDAGVYNTTLTYVVTASF